MEAHLTADLERPDAAVRVRLPAFRERRLEMQVGIRVREVLAGLAYEADAPRVGNGQRIDQPGGYGHSHGQRAHGRFASDAPGCVDRARDDRAGERCGETQQRRMPKEVPPAELAGEVFVDRGVLNGRAVPPKRVERIKAAIHASVESMRSSGEKIFAVMASANCPSSGPRIRSSTTGAT